MMYWLDEFVPDEGQHLMHVRRQHSVIFFSGLGQTEPLLSRVLAGRDVDLVEVLILVERVHRDILAEGRGGHHEHVLHQVILTLW